MSHTIFTYALSYLHEGVGIRCKLLLLAMPPHSIAPNASRTSAHDVESEESASRNLRLVALHYAAMAAPAAPPPLVPPPALKVITQYLQKAAQLDAADAVMAYHCTYCPLICPFIALLYRLGSV